MSHQHKDDGLFDDPRVVTWILRVFYGICAALVLVDFIVHRHIYTAVEKIPAFYALYGFVACVLLVFAAKGLRTLLMRKEDYYDAQAGQNQKTQEDDR
ncbi:hypothetical protein HHX48_16815 [Salinimonas sp. HHU 13199]|uniref:Uncharacterized protein n=1 Tax=Salinimonas profundi TaxID=2729140 RepID=A0ABR8LMH7_9ALTE|nr:hypothetical protein [Salinimonas profundi]MBD3587401.1 hypothetical protein [Salinimonas profundi]